MSRINRRIVIEIVIGLLLISALRLFINHDNGSIWPGNRIKVDSGHRVVYGTFARIIAVASDTGIASKCIESAFEQIHEVDSLMSTYKSDSEISRINRSAYENPVRVSEPTFEVLQRAVEFSKVSDGCFDITVGPLVELWRSADEANSIPTDTDLQEARFKVGYEKLMLDENQMSVRFSVEGMKLDLGGIAKGYAVDRAVTALKECGAIGGMVDIGGDIRLFGAPPPGKENWLIGLQRPGKAGEIPSTDKPLLVLKLAEAAIATSGDYQRVFLVGDRKFSHIINTETGYSSAGLSSVTIISRNATDADALATAVSVMGVEKGFGLIEMQPQTEAILITSPTSPQGYELIKTSGAEKFIE